MSMPMFFFWGGGTELIVLLVQYTYFSVAMILTVLWFSNILFHFSVWIYPLLVVHCGICLNTLSF
jgi:hypothetical protein